MSNFVKNYNSCTSMKTTLINSIFACFCTITAFAQNTISQLPDSFKFDGDDLIISEVVQVEGKKNNDLFKDALLWVNKTFINPKTVIQTKDPDLGLITLKTIVAGPNASISWYEVNISIQVKDGRYKYDITEIVEVLDVRDLGEGIMRNRVGKECINEMTIKNLFIPIVNSLKTQMAKKEEDW